MKLNSGIVSSGSFMKLKYRGEIDGLRAVAVVAVIFFHAQFPWFSGGYVGVDIFFVISGYLITSIILAERDAGTFTILGFYERRVRRILPALFLVIFFTIPFAWMWISPSQLKEFAKSLVAVALFSSNFLFWSESGYFAAVADEKPLLHTWSLAIEEQFYLFFPLMIQSLWIFGRRRLAIITGMIALASFALSAWGFSPGSDANFYLMPSRAWELLVGSLLAFIESTKPLHERVGTRAAQVLSCTGLAMIAYSIIAFDERTPFPGVFSLLPVGGAWMVVAFAVPTTLVGLVLSHRWLVGLGLMSYSAYLWHQPLFTFARLRSLDEPSPAVYACLCIFTGVIAFLSWKYVEVPFRQRHRIIRPKLIKYVILSGGAIIAIGLAGSFTEIGSKRLSAADLASTNPLPSTESACEWQRPLPDFQKIEICHFGATGSNRPVVLWGDSHAEALLIAANQNFKESGISGVMIRNGHCRPIVGIYERSKLSPDVVELCERSQAALLNLLQHMQRRAVVIVIRWTFQLFPIDGMIDELGFDNGEGGRELKGYREYVAVNESDHFVTDAGAKETAIRKFVASFSALGTPVLVQYPVPEVGWHVPNRNFRYLVSTGKVPSVISTSASRFSKRNSFIIAVLDSVTSQPGVLGFKPSDIFCNTFVPHRCVVQINGTPLYFDDNHLSNEGGDLVVKQIIKNLE